MELVQVMHFVQWLVTALIVPYFVYVQKKMINLENRVVVLETIRTVQDSRAQALSDQLTRMDSKIDGLSASLVERLDKVFVRVIDLIASRLGDQS